MPEHETFTDEAILNPEGLSPEQRLARIEREWVRSRRQRNELVVQWRRTVRGMGVMIALTVGLSTWLNHGQDVQNGRISKNTEGIAEIADAQCERAIRFVPPILDFYERVHAIDQSVIDAYRESLPKSCPKSP